MLIICIGATILACADKKTNGNANDDKGRKLYKQNCVICHGSDGKLGINGSKDLTISTLNLEERKTIISNGKGAMVGLKSILSPEEIDAVAQYTFKLKK